MLQVCTWRRPVRGLAGLLLPAVAALALAGCQSGGQATSAGPSPATTAGRPMATFASPAAARAAFTRRSSDDVLIATLDDVAWLRFAGPADEVERRHRSYFELGYTTFQVLLRPKEYTRPTQETFLLEDDQGRKVRGRPVTFQSSMSVQKDLSGDRWDYSFELAFQHVLDADTQWIRLTRELDGQSVEWRLGG